jgi:hypothetical protein
VLLLSQVGCATLFPRSNPFVGGRGVSFLLEVENQNFSRAALYMVSDVPFDVRRVGDVEGNGRGAFEVPWASSASVTFHIELLANGTCTTEYVVINPGDELELRILPDFPNGFCRSTGRR